MRGVRVRGVAGQVGGAPGRALLGGEAGLEVAGGVQRQPAVEAHHGDGEQRLERAPRAVALDGVAQVEPDGVGHAVAVVVDVVDDLAGGGVGDQVGERRAAGRVVNSAGPQDARSRGRGRTAPVGGRQDAGAVVRRDDDLAVGALERQEPVLKVGGVVVFVHAQHVGVAELGLARRVAAGGQQCAVEPEVAELGEVRHAGAVEGALEAAVEVEDEARARLGQADGRTADLVPDRGDAVGDGERQDVVRPRAEVAQDLEGLRHRHLRGIRGVAVVVVAEGVDVRQLQDPAREVEPVEGDRPGDGNVRVDGDGAVAVDRRGADHRQEGAIGQAGEEAVGEGVVAVHVALQAVAADGRGGVARVVDDLRQGVVHHRVGLGERLGLRVAPRADLGLAAGDGERHADQGEQAEHGEDQDEHDAPASPAGRSVTDEHEATPLRSMA